MTATPRYLTDRVKQIARTRDLALVSMDDESRFGPMFHQLSFRRAIEGGLLSDYEVVIVGVADSSVGRSVHQADIVSLDGKVTDARTLASQIALAKAMRSRDLRRVISFHSRVSGAQTFA